MEAWQELRHYLGRLHSYRQAAEVILAANERWPKLFQDFQVFAIPCGRKAPNPFLNRQLTAETIVRNMLWDDEDPRPYLRQVRGLNAIGLSNEIQDLVNRTTFRPFVHAEVQIHAALIRQDIFRSTQFWNGHKYLGCSKPTCRLCAYYFFERGDGIQVRPSHQNIYLPWRLPDVYRGQGLAEERTHRQLLGQITERVRKDAKLVLNERLPSRRKHDSSSPSLLCSYIQDSVSSFDNLGSESSWPGIDASAPRSSVPRSYNSLSHQLGEEEEALDIEEFGELCFIGD